jgi:hypothetical protein
MLEKIKAWIKATGLTNVGYGAGFFAALTFGFPYIAGACAGIFVYVNFNVLRKIVLGAVTGL